MIEVYGFHNDLHFTVLGRSQLRSRKCPGSLACRSSTYLLILHETTTPCRFSDGLRVAVIN